MPWCALCPLDVWQEGRRAGEKMEAGCKTYFTTSTDYFVLSPVVAAAVYQFIRFLG